MKTFYRYPNGTVESGICLYVENGLAKIAESQTGAILWIPTEWVFYWGGTHF